MEATVQNLTGSITPKPLPVSLVAVSNVSKVYDGQTSVRVDSVYYGVGGAIAGDKIWLAGNGHFEDKNAGASKMLTLDVAEIRGPDGDNYAIASLDVRLIASISPKPLSVAFKPTATVRKVYDGTLDAVLQIEDYELTGVVAGDDVVPGNALSGMYESKDVGVDKIVKVTGITLSGAQAGNYSLYQQSLQSAVGEITPAMLTITADDKVRNQGEPNPKFTFNYEGFMHGDVPADLRRLPEATTVAVPGSPMGLYDIDVAGAASGNYIFSYVKGRLAVFRNEGIGRLTRIWMIGRNIVNLSVQSDIAQRAVIVMYNHAGQPVTMQQRTLNAGNNSLSLPVSNLSAGTYTLRVATQQFNNAKNFNVR